MVLLACFASPPLIGVVRFPCLKAEAYRCQNRKGEAASPQKRPGGGGCPHFFSTLTVGMYQTGTASGPITPAEIACSTLWQGRQRAVGEVREEENKQEHPAAQPTLRRALTCLIQATR